MNWGMVPKVEGSNCELDYPPRSVCYRKKESMKRNSTHIDVKMAVKFLSFLEKLQQQKTICNSYEIVLWLHYKFANDATPCVPLPQNYEGAEGQ